MKAIWVLLACFVLGESSPAWAQKPIRFSLRAGELDLTNSVAEPGQVRIPVKPTDVNIEVADWATAPAPTNYTGEFTVRLQEATLVGCLIVYGAKTIRYEMAGRWKQLEPGPESDRFLQVLPLPAGEFVETLEVLVPAVRQKPEGDKPACYQARLAYLTLMPVRAENVARTAAVTVSSTDKPGPDDASRPWLHKPETLVDGFVDEKSNFSSARRTAAISPESPEWVLLSWKQPQSIRGVGIFLGSAERGFGQSVTEIFKGEGDPTGARGTNDWQALDGRVTLPGPFRSAQLFVARTNLASRGLCIRSVGGVEQIQVGEVVVLSDLGSAPGPRIQK